MLTPREFYNQYSEEEIANEFPDQTIASLRDIQRLYGKLYVLATADSGEYASFYTPDAANDIKDDRNSLIVVRADLSGESPHLDPENPVEFREYTDDLISKVGLCYYSRKGSGVEHSISHKTGGDKDRTDIIGYAEDRLNRWTTEDPVLNVAETHDDGQIIQDLISLGRNQQQLRKLGKEIYWNFGQEDDAETEDGSDSSEPETTRAIVTVRVKTEPDGEYKWPGEVAVLNAGMKAQRMSKLVSKNDASNSSGTATGYVTGETTEVVGTADDPLNHFLSLQRGGFPNLNTDEAWRNHPVSKETAILLNKSTTFLDACNYYTDDTFATFGSNVYYLPYVTTPITPEKIYNLYTLLYRLVKDDDSSLTPLVRASQNLQEIDTDNLRFYITTLNEYENARYDSLGSRMNCRVHFPEKLAASHKAVLNSWLYSNQEIIIGDEKTTISSPQPKQEEWALLNDRNLLQKVTNGSYLYEVMSGRDDDGEGETDDSRITTFLAILAGEQVSATELLDEYVDRIIEDSSDTFPDLTVASQYAQLIALANADMLRDSNGRFKTDTANIQSLSETLMANPDDSTTDKQDDISRAALREQKLQQFIEETPWADDPERRGAFLIGALVGQVSTYQRTAEDVSETLVSNHPVGAITNNRLERIVQRALDRTYVYSDIQGLYTTMYEELVSRIVDATSQAPPSDYTLPTTEIKFYYSLGVGYGQNNWISQEEIEAELDAREEVAAE